MQKSLIKKLLYKSTHRGCKETDIILGIFAETFLDHMSGQELIDFENILEQSDADIYDWCLQKTDIPKPLESNLINKLIKFTTYNYKI